MLAEEKDLADREGQKRYSTSKGLFSKAPLKVYFFLFPVPCAFSPFFSDCRLRVALLLILQ